MYIAEARAYNEGIEFYPKNGKVIFAKRCNGKVVVESRNSSYSEKKENSFKSKIFLLFFCATAILVLFAASAWTRIIPSYLFSLDNCS